MHKVAFEITIHWYGILVVVGCLAGLWTATRRGLSAGVHGEIVADLGMWLILGAMFGARFLYVVSYWQEEFASKPLWEVVRIRQGGLVFYGGLIGAALSGLAYVRIKRLPFWKLADVLAPSIALGHFFGRFGCLMTGCCYGRPTHLPWAISFPEDHWTAGALVHPTQIYEALLNLALYAALAWWFRRRKFDGQIFAAYLVGYALLRFVVDFFRGDYPTHYLGGLVTPGQLVSLGVLAAGLILYRARRHRAPSGVPVKPRSA